MSKIKSTNGYKIFTFFNTILMIILVLITVYPIYYCLVASFSDSAKLTLNAGKLLLVPLKPYNTEAYRRVFQHPLFLSGWRNTVIILIIGTLINMFMTIISGYPLAQKNMMLNRPISLFIIFTMYFSGGLIPNYLNVRDFGMTNTLWSLIIPGAMSVYNLIIMRTAFASIPDSLIESAQLDGARHFTILYRVALPLVKPTLAVLVLYYAVGHWNSWFAASIYLQDTELFPLQLVMQRLLDSANVDMLSGVDAADQANFVELIKYALIVVSTVPILLIYPFLQKYFVNGVMLGAVKG